MSDKMTCPGCDAHTSGVLAAFRQQAPCPYCGLSWAAIAEIDALRSARGDEALKGKLAEAIKARSKAEDTAREAEYRLRKVRDALEAPVPDLEVALVSADYHTKLYLGYHHDDHVAVFDRSGAFIGAFGEQEMRELQSLADQWRDGLRRIRETESGDDGRQQQERTAEAAGGGEGEADGPAAEGEAGPEHKHVAVSAFGLKFVAGKAVYTYLCGCGHTWEEAA